MRASSPEWCSGYWGGLRLRRRLFADQGTTLVFSRQFLAKRLFALGHERLVPCRINIRILMARTHPGELGFHIEITAVRAEKYVARQRLEHLKTVGVVGRDVRIACIVH